MIYIFHYFWHYLQAETLRLSVLENVSINYFPPKGEYDLSAHRVGTRGLGGSLTPWIYFVTHIIRNKKKKTRLDLQEISDGRTLLFC